MAQACPRCSTTWLPSEGLLGQCPKCLLGWAAGSSGDPVHIGGCEILGRLGAGGMGVVYRARQQELGREVALKLLSAGEDADRFLREAQAAARLSHPNIVPVFEVGRHENRPYYLMELVDGATLADRLKSGPLEPRDAADAIRQGALALDHAHNAGILHRDVKPSNLLLDRGGRARLADFGIARDLNRETRATSSGSVLGTPSYMAPEQAEGNATAASDVYSLGATLYECLTGRPPFVGPTAARVIYAIINSDADPPRRHRPSVPRDLELICLKCLNKKPAERYESAAALAEDLGRFLRGEPVQAKATHGIVLAGRAVAKYRFALGLAAGLVFALAILLTPKPPAGPPPAPPDESAALRLLGEARALTAPAAAARRQAFLRDARREAKTPQLALQIDDLLGRADASPWFALLLTGADPCSTISTFAELESALAFDPNSWRLWLVACALHLRDGNPEAAIEAARHARLLAPDLAASAAFEAIAYRAAWHFGGVDHDDPLKDADPANPIIALAAAIRGSVTVQIDGSVAFNVDSCGGAALGDVPRGLLPIRAWMRLLREEIDGARQDLAGCPENPAATAQWRLFVDRVRRAVERPDEAWVLLAQARVRVDSGRDPEPRVAKLLETLEPEGYDTRADVFFRYPALALRARWQLSHGDKAGALKTLDAIPRGENADADELRRAAGGR